MSFWKRIAKPFRQKRKDPASPPSVVNAENRFAIRPTMDSFFKSKDGFVPVEKIPNYSEKNLRWMRDVGILRISRSIGPSRYFEYYFVREIDGVVKGRQIDEDLFNEILMEHFTHSRPARRKVH